MHLILNRLWTLISIFMLDTEYPSLDQISLKVAHLGLNDFCLCLLGSLEIAYVFSPLLYSPNNF